MGLTDWSEATGAPAESTCPSSTCRMATRPSNGARIDFLAIIASRLATAAAALLGARLGQVEVGLGVDESSLRRARVRSRLIRARAASAWAAD